MRVVKLPDIFCAVFHSGRYSLHGAGIRRAIRAAGARLFFLPPYSPDLNSIEQVFAKLKTLLRKAAERTVEATWRHRKPAQLIPPQECANYLRNAGYASV